MNLPPVTVSVPWLSIAPPSWAVLESKVVPLLIMSVPFLAAKIAPPSCALLFSKSVPVMVPLPEVLMAPPRKRDVLPEKSPPVMFRVPLLLTPPPLFDAELPVTSVS